MHDVTIGGGSFFDSYDDRNLIGSTNGLGVVVDGETASLVAGHDNHITGNFIGAGYSTANGTFVDRGNLGAGVTLAGPGNEVLYNLIAYNGSYGVNLTNSAASANSVVFNCIGNFGATDTGLGNGGGIVVQNAAHDNYLSGNAIRYNSGTGIRVISGQENLIISNNLYGNNGLGIDLAGAGVTANDNDSDSQPVNYANRGLNFPVIDQAIGGHRHGLVTGSLLTTPGDYAIGVCFSLSCDASGTARGNSRQEVLSFPPAMSARTASSWQRSAIRWIFPIPTRRRFHATSR